MSTATYDELSQVTSNPAVPMPSKPPVVARNTAVDAYRGFVMLLMMGEVLEFARVARSYPGNWLWSFLAFNQSHVEWAGCSLHDMIQPSFSFLVGVAVPYSIASRLHKGTTFETLFGHTIWRSFLLVALGVFLRSMDRPQTYFTFEDTPAKSASVIPFFSCWLFARRAGNGARWVFCFLVTGWRGRFILLLERILIGLRLVCRRIGPQFFGFCRTLEQEQQFRERLRSVVPESVPARETFRR